MPGGECTLYNSLAEGILPKFMLQPLRNLLAAQKHPCSTEPGRGRPDPAQGAQGAKLQPKYGSDLPKHSGGPVAASLEPPVCSLAATRQFARPFLTAELMLAGFEQVKPVEAQGEGALQDDNPRI